MSVQRKILQVLSRSKQFGSVATVTPDNKPWVRYISLNVPSDENDMTIRFASFLGAREIVHLRENAEIHILCGSQGIEEGHDYVQIQGIAEISTEKKERDLIWSDESAKYFKGPDDPNYAVVIVKPYLIEYWNAESWIPEIWEIKEDNKKEE